MTIGLLFKNNFLSVLRRWTHLTTHRAYSIAAQGYKHETNVLGYSVKEVDHISELNMKAILLEHQLTGAEHLHLACEDSNNLFGVAFRTPPADSTGVSHILEHLALCGSKKFPCRDPFFNMLNRSLATFMNAFTGSDITIYAFSSQNAKDFQNLLSVYLDATFYPSLLEKDFRQEGWRLEHEDVKDRQSPIVFKGVVFNEMKGVFSDSNQYYARHLQNCLFPDNAYSHESGGDPLSIPHLSWEGLRNFHSKLYHPSNSRFITYGNMPLDSHLEQIQSHVLQNFHRMEIASNVSQVQRWSTPREVTINNRFDPMAASPEKQTIVSNSYVLHNITDTHENFALSILGTLLVDGPNAPFYQRLLESGIGPDYSPSSGFDSSLKESVFSVGLREIADKDIEHVKDLIESTFDAVVERGFPEEQIKAVLHRVELATKHRTSNFGLNCALGVSSMWNQNGNPISAFKVNDHVRWFLGQMSENKHFLQDKVVQHFKNNNHRLTLIMKPIADYELQQQEREKKFLESRVNQLTNAQKLEIYKQGLELAEHQQSVDASCLPTLRIGDVKKELDRIPLTFISIGNVPVQLCEQPTNELVYFKAVLDASSISEEDIMLLPLFASVITQMGAGSRNYKQFDQEVQLKSGGLSSSLYISEDPSDSTLFTQSLRISSYCLEKNVSDMFSLWKDVFRNICLDDRDRLSQLIRLNAADMAQSISGHGHVYSMRRACSSLSLCGQRREKTSGLSQIEYMKKLAEMENHDEVLEKLRNLSDILFKKASLKCALNATPTFMKSAVKSLEAFLSDVNSVTGSNPADHVKMGNHQSENEKTHFVLSLSVNYLGQSFLTVPFCHPHFSSLKVAAKLLSSKFLHGEIRERGGAYGGGASISNGGHFMFYSYRDPNVAKTLKSFSSGVNWLLESKYTDQDIDEAKLGVFSEVDAPVTPGSKGSQLFLENITQDMKEEMRKRIFDCKREDLIAVSQKYLKDSQRIGTALIGPENQFTKSEDHGWTIMMNKL